MPDHLFCTRCGATHNDKVKTTIIGTRKFICGCGHKNTFPPGSVMRIVYGCLWCFMASVIFVPLKDGGIVIPGIPWFIILIVSAKAWDNIGKIRRARSFHAKQGTLGKPPLGAA